MIKLRMDVDYPYPSRLQSFLFTILNRTISNNYLKNSKIIARMVNESQKEVKAYWFFTPKTIPDQEMLNLIAPSKHEVALHVANKPYEELANLEKVTKRKIQFYTIHGTARLFARIMWRRKIWEARTTIPKGFPLKDFWELPTLSLDLACYSAPGHNCQKTAQTAIDEGKILHIHPEWLFNRGTLNHRGPYYETLRTILEVDEEIKSLVIRRKGFAKIANFAGIAEYQEDHIPTNEFSEKLRERGIDIFSFLERGWTKTITSPPAEWAKAKDNIALLQVETYDEWWKKISKKTRNMVRKAEKSEVKSTIVEPNENFIEGVWKIYNETPVRQGRAFPHYGTSLESVKNYFQFAKSYVYLGAFFKDELVGFIELIIGNNIAVISQILSIQEHWDKAVNNALIAKTVEICAEKKIKWIMYGRMGNHPSLDNFKEANGFSKFILTRYYVPLTWKGKTTIQLKLHRDLKDSLPQGLKGPLFPVFGWISRVKMQIRLKLK